MKISIATSWCSWYRLSSTNSQFIHVHSKSQSFELEEDPHVILWKRTGNFNYCASNSQWFETHESVERTMSTDAMECFSAWNIPWYWQSSKNTVRKVSSKHHHDICARKLEERHIKVLVVKKKNAFYCFFDREGKFGYSHIQSKLRRIWKDVRKEQWWSGKDRGRQIEFLRNKIKIWW